MKVLPVDVPARYDPTFMLELLLFEEKHKDAYLQQGETQ